MVGWQKNTHLCFKISMESTLCNSVCTLFLQPIFIAGSSSGFAWEYECLANSHVQDVHHKLPNAHKACCFTSSRPGCYCSHGLMLARTPLSTQTHRKLSKLESHTSQFSNPSILEASQMLNKHQTITWPSAALWSHAQLWIDCGGTPNAFSISEFMLSTFPTT